MAHVDNMVFLGRRLAIRWFQPDRATEASQQVKNQQFAASLQGLGPDQLLALAQLLDPSFAAVQPMMPASEPNFAAAQAALPAQVGLDASQPGWSSLVNSWLNDYVSFYFGALAWGACGHARGRRAPCKCVTERGK